MRVITQKWSGQSRYPQPHDVLLRNGLTNNGFTTKKQVARCQITLLRLKIMLINIMINVLYFVLNSSEPYVRLRALNLTVPSIKVVYALNGNAYFHLLDLKIKRVCNRFFDRIAYSFFIKLSNFLYKQSSVYKRKDTLATKCVNRVWSICVKCARTLTHQRFTKLVWIHVQNRVKDCLGQFNIAFLLALAT